MIPDLFLTTLLVLSILAGCIAMTRGMAPSLTLSVAALVGLCLSGSGGEAILRESFQHFAEVALAFTAVGIPAHRIAAAGGFARVARLAASRVGVATLGAAAKRRTWVVVGCLVATFVLAGIAHNSTAIWTMAGLTLEVCRAFRIPPRWILCGELVASNLGGFSTAWGDTPNMVEARTWGLDASDFATEILPINLVVLAILVAVVLVLVRRDTLHDADPMVDAAQTAGLRVDAASARFDARQVATNAAILVAYLVAHVQVPEGAIAFAAAAVFASVLAAPPSEREEALGSLGFELYLTFAAVFVLAGCMAHSSVGEALRAAIEASGASTGVVLLSSYIGTLLTEAASWATAAAPLVHEVDPSHRAAWALGAGICAGSSSVLTAASAGILLATETRRSGAPEERVGFREYLGFGIVFSVIMLAFYAVALTVRFGGGA